MLSVGFASILLVLILAFFGCGSDDRRATTPVKTVEDTPADDSTGPDTLAPDTILLEAPPSLTNLPDASFTFTGTDTGGSVHFQCKLDSAGWSNCVSPMTYNGLGEISHRFEVRAVDEAGNVDVSPSFHVWRVDRTPPETEITSSPPASTSATDAAVTMRSSDDVAIAGFECNLDAAGWIPCTSPAEYAALATGVHSLAIRAMDGAGNLDASPAFATWTVLPPVASLSAGCFTGGTSPQLDLTGPDADWTWNDPHVLKAGSQYWMYASATDFFVFPVRSYRLVSSDGVQWARSPTEPVLADAQAGAWDAGGVETPAVVWFNGRYHLFYTGYRYKIGDPLHSVFDFRVGHAVSDDGVTFSRPTTEPIVAPSGTDAETSNDWYAFIVGEPGPVVYNGELYVYFTTVGADDGLGASLQVIGVVRSADGVTWSAPELVLKPDNVLYPRDQDWVGYSTPNAIVINEAMHLFFDVAHQPAGGEWLQLRLHHAYSPDGVTQWAQDPAPLRSAGDFAWAVDEIRSPHALLDGTKLRLYFAGHELDGVSPEHFAVGELSCDLAQ